MSMPEFVRGMDVPAGTVMPRGFELGNGKRRLASCVEQWPECGDSDYDPHCCRFPKSCSATSVPNQVYRVGDLEPAPESREQNDGTTLKVGDLRKAMDGLPDDAQMFINIPGYGEDFAVKAAWQSLQIPDGVKDWRNAEQVVGLEIHLGQFEETW